MKIIVLLLITILFSIPTFAQDTEIYNHDWDLRYQIVGKGVKSTFDSYHFIAKAKRRLDPFNARKAIKSTTRTMILGIERTMIRGSVG